MLFALGSARKRFNDHQNAALNFGAVFDNTVTKDAAKSDWPGSVAQAVAVCGSKTGTSLTSGQVQGLKGNRLYAATLSSPDQKRSYGDGNSAMGLSDLRLLLSAPLANTDTVPVFGEWGYVQAERSVTYLFRRGGAPQVYCTYTIAQNYSGHVGTDTIYTDTVAAGLQYTRTGRMPTTLLGTTVTTGADYSSVGSVGYTAQGTAQSSGSFFGTTDGGYRVQQSGRNAQGQFWSNNPVFYNGNGLTGSVAASTDRNLRISMSVSGPDETPVPVWMGNVIQIGKDYFMMQYDIGQGLDVESVSALVPGNSANFTVKINNFVYPDRVPM